MKQINFNIKPSDQDRLVLDAMRQLHNEYVRAHEDEFFAPGNEYQRYLFMPFELIGWEAAKKYFFQLDLQSLGSNTAHKQKLFRKTYQVVVDEESIRGAYVMAQRQFRKECSITSIYSFYRLFHELRKHGYDISPAITAALQADEDLVFQVAAQVLRRNRDVFCAAPRDQND